MQRCTGALLRRMGAGRNEAQRAAAEEAASVQKALRTVEQRYIDLMQTLQFGKCGAESVFERVIALD